MGAKSTVRIARRHAISRIMLYLGLADDDAIGALLDFVHGDEYICKFEVIESDSCDESGPGSEPSLGTGTWDR